MLCMYSIWQQNGVTMVIEQKMFILGINHHTQMPLGPYKPARSMKPTIVQNDRNRLTKYV